MRINKRNEETRKSCFSNEQKVNKSMALPKEDLGQNCPRHYPQAADADLFFGGPLGIEDVALLLGCSPWTVRQKYLPEGMPHLRASVRGRFVFFRQQIIDWILQRQTKGGMKAQR